MMRERLPDPNELLYTTIQAGSPVLWHLTLFIFPQVPNGRTGS